MGTMLIGYDVEWLGDGDVTPRFLEQARLLHNRDFLGLLGGVVARRSTHLPVRMLPGTAQI
jgi:hypothetical protein